MGDFNIFVPKNDYLINIVLYDINIFPNSISAIISLQLVTKTAVKSMAIRHQVDVLLHY